VESSARHDQRSLINGTEVDSDRVTATYDTRSIVRLALTGPSFHGGARMWEGIPRADVKNVLLNLLAQATWVILVAVSTSLLTIVFGSAGLTRIWSTEVDVPSWVILLAGLVGLVMGSSIFFFLRLGSVVRGRTKATEANVKLMASRRRVDQSNRVVRSTRFGRWPLSEQLHYRSKFREELDAAILNEGADVRRIWNVSSGEDAQRLREILSRYQGKDNHSIRVYFGIPDHVMPELLVVDKRGASISFPSTRTPHGLDWMIGFKRDDLASVISDYFDVLWDRATRVLDAGEVAAEGLEALAEFEATRAVEGA
jgi:hypothetical protein